MYKRNSQTMNKIWILSSILLLTACQQQGKAGDSPETSDTTVIATSQDANTTATGSTAPVFQTMGKVVAARYADVKFETVLPVTRVMVRNGDRVRQGQLLAVQDSRRQENAVEQHQREIEQARLQMQEVIISQGYDPDQMDRVPQRVRHIAEVKSGLLIAQNKLAAACDELNTTRVTAPFDGIVANVKAHAGQLAQTGDVVCRVISPQQMEVEFRVMESDLGRFPIGTAISVVPVADEHALYDAKVTEINPVVDEQGTVMLRARVATPNSLFDGMHVSVNLKTPQP
jgi:RND family efflux transporter MFP subunit